LDTKRLAPDCIEVLLAHGEKHKEVIKPQFLRRIARAIEQQAEWIASECEAQSPGTQFAEVLDVSPENPKAFVLTTKKEMPQWADYRELNIGGGRLEVLKCKIETESPYFRFGFKLLNENGRLFGGGSIKSQDANLVVHVGRNNWNRPNLGISAKDIFFTMDLNGVPPESDKKVFSAGRRLSASFELRISSSYVVTFSVNGIHCMNRVISPGICRRIVVLAWGDGEEYEVEVSDLSVNPRSGS
jgi:hypothetical protein